MDARLALVPNGEDTSRGVVRLVTDNGILYGRSVGHWTSSTIDGNIHVILNQDVDTITHEVATSKAIRAELRAAERDANGVEIKPIITYDPKTRRFKEVYPVKEE